MTELPTFVVRPPLRCHHQVGDRPRRFCGLPAHWMGYANGMFGIPYFCDAHFRPGNVVIVPGSTFLQVTVRVDVVLAGVSLQPHASQREAVELVDRLVTDAGGLPSLVDVTSRLGRYGTTPATRDEPRGRGPTGVGGA